MRLVRRTSYLMATGRSQQQHAAPIPEQPQPELEEGVQPLQQLPPPPVAIEGPQLPPPLTSVDAPHKLSTEGINMPPPPASPSL